MANNLICPNCSKPKKPWFALCWECSEKEKQKPKCEVCGIPVPEDHTLCKEHWIEKQEEKKQLERIDHVKSKKEQEFRDKFEGKYRFNGFKVKSKSEVIICYFLTTNQIRFQYETPIYLNNKEYRPDFVIDDGKGNVIIYEHFGRDEDDYLIKMEDKIKKYKNLCKNTNDFHFIWTTEEDILNLNEKLGKKFNETPLKRAHWK